MLGKLADEVPRVDVLVRGEIENGLGAVENIIGLDQFRLKLALTDPTTAEAVSLLLVALVRIVPRAVAGIRFLDHTW